MFSKRKKQPGFLGLQEFCLEHVTVFFQIVKNVAIVRFLNNMKFTCNKIYRHSMGKVITWWIKIFHRNFILFENFDAFLEKILLDNWERDLLRFILFDT